MSPAKAPPRPGIHRKVTSLANPLVKDIRALHLKKHREKAGLFLAEGLQLVRFALDAGWPARMIIYPGEAAGQETVLATAARCKAGGALVLEVSAPVLAKLSRRDNPQSVLGVFAERFHPLSAVGRSGLWIALEEVRDPGNLGTIIRTADAAGAAGVALVGTCCDPFSLETVRATMGSIFHVPIVRASPLALAAQARKAKTALVGTHLGGGTDYRDAGYPERLILAMGNEQKGLSDALAGACDTLVRIPMVGRAESLNLAVAAGLMIYEARRARI